MNPIVSNSNLKPLILKHDPIPGYFITEDADVYDFTYPSSPRIIIPIDRHSSNQVYVHIRKANGEYGIVRLDLLVVSTFLGYHDDIIHIVHIDDNTKNCSLKNLRVIRVSQINEKYKEMYHVEDLNDIPEEWKVTDVDPTLEVSNFGDVRSKEENHPLNVIDSHGYRVFYYHNNLYSVHRLVAQAFVKNPRPDKFKYINHIDGNKSNNAFFNLEWCDIAMNTEHTFMTGLMNSYTPTQIHNVCQLLSVGLPHTEISEITGVTRKFISEIYRGRKHRSIAALYNIKVAPSRDEKYHRSEVIKLINDGFKTKEIAEKLGIEYSQPFISYYEKLKRDIRQGKV